jgi:hypothetical protein
MASAIFSVSISTSAPFRQRFTRLRLPGHRAKPNPVVSQPPNARPHAAPSRCFGGHGVVPYEQNTQHVPALGRSVAPHARHW